MKKTYLMLGALIFVALIIGVAIGMNLRGERIVYQTNTELNNYIDNLDKAYREFFESMNFTVKDSYIQKDIWVGITLSGTFVAHAIIENVTTIYRCVDVSTPLKRVTYFYFYPDSSGNLVAAVFRVW